MAKDPDLRYATTVELAEAARAALSTPLRVPRTAAPSSPANPTRPASRPNVVAPQQDPHDPAPALPPRTDDQSAPEPVASPRPRLRPGAVVVLAVVAVTVAILAIGTVVYLSRSEPHPPEGAIGQSMAPSGPAPTSVAETALLALLLSPDQLDTATGATGMTVTGTLTTLPDASGQVPDKACVPLEGAGQATVYAGSGFTAVDGQRASDQTHAHLVEQIVVSFPSAEEARAFFAAAAQRWPTCANRPHDETTPAGQTEAHTVGPVSNTNGTLSATITGVLARNGSSGACERALTLANNVAIDIAACGQSPSGAAINIADQIAAKVPGPH
jgi:serine/threonine kinase PknH